MRTAPRHRSPDACPRRARHAAVLAVLAALGTFVGAAIAGGGRALQPGMAAAAGPTDTPTATPPPQTATPRRTAARTVTSHPTVTLDAQANPTVTLDALPNPIIVGGTLGLTGTGFTQGSVLVLFVSAGGGAVTYGPLAPSAVSPTALSVPIPTSVGLGNGFASLEVVNTDQGFIESNVRWQYLFGSAASNLPTIMTINSVALEPPDPAVPLNSVATVLVQGSTVTLGGSGFNNPRVALFSSNPSAANLTPLAGGTSTQIQVVVPMNIPTGPGAIQVVNDPFVGNVVSNIVSVPIGERIRIDSVSQNGSTITVTGAGFSVRTVISFFNAQPGGVVNLGGVVNGTQSLIPLTVISSHMFTFQIPAGAASGPSYVQALNPPFIPFTSSGNTPNGALNLVVPTARGGGSLHFFGNGNSDIDRVKIPLDNPARPVDVGADFTLEFWMKTAAGNASGACSPGGDNWINGNIIVDRDVFGSGDFGDYGVSVSGSGGHLAFGVNRLGTGNTICGAANVANGAWHHVAVTRSTATGQLRIFVDGQPDATGSGPTGDVSYRDGRPTNFPNSDPFLVIGAEKHDAQGFASFHGWIDELRVSSSIRYAGAFTPAGPFTTDANTVALYHFDEGNGNNIIDSSNAAGGPSNGVRRFGGSPSPGPQWSPDTPFAHATPVIALQTLTSALSGPTSITHAGDTRLFITEMGGTIRIWDGAQLLPTPFLTVTPISSGGERGLLSVAFHPHYAQNGFFYVYYTDPAGQPTIARYKVSANPNVADASSGVVLLSIPHPGQANHNGGQLQFGPDGYLYAGIGDGGGGCDNSGSGCNAQRDNRLLGKLLRLDVDQNVNTPPFYGIPASNPFVGPGDPLDEIWAKGVRNPWRFSFDRLTSSLFIGDVGEGTREEVDLQSSDAPGGRNYGWKRMEGSLCNTCDLSDCPVPPPPCNDPSLTLPILEYGHNPECAITGGYVYRGTQIPFLYGKYLYGDLCSGALWWAVDNEGTWTATKFPATASQLWTWGQDVAGELYLARGTGALVKIVPGP